MRQIVLDTETTGLEASRGDRIIEIGCVELASRKLTGRRFHRYFNPERDIEAGAQAVHGITAEFLQDKPRFRDAVGELLEFLRGAELIIHNAAFDVGFLNRELELAGLPPLERHVGGVVDTLRLAKELHPGRRNSLDALCERYAIDHSRRTLHGALLDAELLAEAYLAMTRGQENLGIDLGPAAAEVEETVAAGVRLPLRVVRATAEELEAHARVLEEIRSESRGKCLWAAGDPA